MIVLSDNDVRGAVRALHIAIESSGCAEFLEGMSVEFKVLEDVGLAENSSDQSIWEYCQDQKCILLTADRSAKAAEASFEHIVKQSGIESSLPIITIADPYRITHDRDYAERCALRLLDYLDRIEDLLGAGRIYLTA